LHSGVNTNQGSIDYGRRGPHLRCSHPPPAVSAPLPLIPSFQEIITNWLTFLLDGFSLCSPCYLDFVTSRRKPASIDLARFSPKRCNSAGMDPEPKAIQQRKDRNSTRSRRKKQASKAIHLSLTDFLNLLPRPVFPNRSLVAMERQLDVRRARLERALAHRTKKEIVLRPRLVRVPKLIRLEALAKQVETLPTHRKCLTRREFAVYVDALRQMRGVIATLVRKFRRLENIDKQYRYWARVGEIFLDAPSDAFESFLVTRRNHSGKNLHAVAMVRMRHATPQQLAEWGRRGGQASQRKRRLTAAAAESTTSPRGASPNEPATTSELESE
jgi:hypothetical protein